MGKYLNGIDISHWQGPDIDFKKVQSDGKSFAFLKATDGYGWSNGHMKKNVDNCFKRNVSKAEKLDFVLGAYHFFRPTENLQAQINSFSAMVLVRTEPLLIALDIEPTKNGPAGKEQWDEIADKKERLGMVKNWLEAVAKNTGAKPIIYTSNFFVNDFLPLDPGLADYPLWLARYAAEPGRIPPPWTSWKFWQHTPKGKVDGITGDVDLNYFDGTIEELQALAAPCPKPSKG